MDQVEQRPANDVYWDGGLVLTDDELRLSELCLERSANNYTHRLTQLAIRQKTIEIRIAQRQEKGLGSVDADRRGLKMIAQARKILVNEIFSL